MKISLNEFKQKIENNKDILDFMKAKNFIEINITELPIEYTHSVFCANAPARDAYLKVGEQKDMNLEHVWYSKLGEIGIRVPETRVVNFGNSYVLISEKIDGEEVLDIIKKSARATKLEILEDLLIESAFVSVGIMKKYPENVETFFGQYDKKTADFLVGLITKRLSLDTESDLFKILRYIALDLTNAERVFYRDYMASNVILDTNGNFVPIDMGSTAYRPAPFELVAMIQTPYLGLRLTNEEMQDKIDMHYAAIEAFKEGDSREKVRKDKFLIEINESKLKDYRLLTSKIQLVKNFSGIASRNQYITDNKKRIMSDNCDKAMETMRLIQNVEGRRFHIDYVIYSLQQLADADFCELCKKPALLDELESLITEK